MSRSKRPREMKLPACRSNRVQEAILYVLIRILYLVVSRSSL